MNGKIWIERYDHYYPRVDSGISKKNSVHIERGQLTDENRTLLGPVGTKIAEKLLMITGITEFFISFDHVFLVRVNGNPPLRREVAKAICAALNWDEAILYDVYCDNFLERVHVDKPLIVKLSSSGQPGYFEIKARGGWGKGLDTQSFEKPLNELDLIRLHPTTAVLVRAIMAIPGVRAVFTGNEAIDVFVRKGYSQKEIEPDLREALKRVFPGVQFTEA